MLLLLLAVVAAIAVVAAGPLDRAAIDGLRFTVAFRGYRMDEVDAALDRLTDELDRRDLRIAELERPRSGEPADAAEREA